jgi:hypothetical protein
MSDLHREPAPPEWTDRPLARDAAERRRRRDLALFLPLLGAALLVSPIVNLVADAGNIAGIPVSILYVFGVWFALIVATARLAARLRADDGEG